MTGDRNHPPGGGATEPGNPGEETWLSELYQEAATEIPPPELDRKIIQAAHGAVHHPLLHRKSWHAPFLYGTAASALLAAGLWFQMERNAPPVPLPSADSAPHQLTTGVESKRRKLRSEAASETGSGVESTTPTMLADQAAVPKVENLAIPADTAVREAAHAPEIEAPALEEVIVTAAQRDAPSENQAVKGRQAPVGSATAPVTTGAVRSFSGVFAVQGQTDQIRIFNVGKEIWLEAVWGGAVSCPTPFRLPDDIALKDITTLSLNASKLALRLPAQEGDLQLYCSMEGWKLQPWPYPEPSQSSP